MYRSILGRAPDAAGLDFWVNAMRNGLPLANVAAEMTASPEGQHVQTINGIYGELLGRYPGTGELAGWVDAMESGTTEAEIRAFIMETEEYKNLQNGGGDGGGGSDPGPDYGYLVTEMYQTLLGRSPTADDIAYWTNALQGGMSLSEAADLIKSSPEYENRQSTTPDIANFDDSGNAIVRRNAGDTLQSLAQKAYGDSSLWYVIAEANGVTFNADLSGLKTIVIPDAPLATGTAAGAGSTAFGSVGFGTSASPANNIRVQNIIAKALQDAKSLFVPQIPASGTLVHGGGTDGSQAIGGGAADLDLVREQQVTALYQRLLGRVPDEGGLEFWRQALASGKALDEITQEIISSPEYVKNHATSPDAPDFAGQDYLVVQRLSGDTLDSLAEMAYGNSWLSYLIASANGVSSNAELEKLDAVIIPDYIEQHDDGIAINYTNTRTGKTWRESYTSLVSTLDPLTIEDFPSQLPPMISGDPIWATTTVTLADGSQLAYRYLTDPSIPAWVLNAQWEENFSLGSGGNSDGADNPFAGNNPVGGNTPVAQNGVLLGMTSDMQQVIVRAPAIVHKNNFFNLSINQQAYLGTTNSIPVSMPATKGAKSKDLKEIKSPSTAPAEVVLSSMQEEFDNLWSKSHPQGNAQEYGGTVVADIFGNLSLVNMGTTNDSGSFRPNLEVGLLETAVGAFHTHPYGKADGTEDYYTGASLSGTDAAFVVNTKLNFLIAQSGTDQFMFVRTDATVQSVNAAAIKAENDQMVQTFVNNGMSFSVATQKTAVQIAQKLGLAYYEGSNGVFKLVH